MSTNRELLELAAKAAGVGPLKDLNRVNAHTGPYVEYVTNDGFAWNPLTDDGDALRLAVQCGIEVSVVDDEPDRDGRSTRACAGYVSDGDRMRYVFEDHRRDLFAATRRAIVRAAAEIAKATNQGAAHD